MSRPPFVYVYKTDYVSALMNASINFAGASLAFTHFPLRMVFIIRHRVNARFTTTVSASLKAPDFERINPVRNTG
jgi:hypothetical protein